MTSLVSILVSVLLLLVISIGYGLTCGKHTLSGLVLFGFACLMSLLFAVDTILITGCAPKNLIFFVYFLICLFGGIQFFRKYHDIQICPKKIWIVFIPFCVVMILIFMNRTLSAQGFDTLHYMSVVNEGVIADCFGFMDYDTGQVTNYISVTDDYESFYHLNSFIIWGWEYVYRLLNIHQVLTIQIYLWTMSLLFSVIMFCFYVELSEELKLSPFQRIVAGVFILLFIAGHYWNNSFSFLGNTYRQFYSAVFMLELCLLFRNKTFSSKECFELSVLTGALIACSSSGFLVSFIFLFGLLIVMLHQNVKEYGKKVIILTVPTVSYGVIYFYHMKSMQWLCFFFVVFFYWFCFLYDKFSGRLQKIVIRILDFVLMIAWVFIVGLSLKSVIFDGFPVLEFFSGYSSYDMIWDYFSFNSLQKIVMNGLILMGFAVFLIRMKFSNYWKYILILLMFFVNPISMAFVRVYMADILSQRILETIFNYTSCTLFVLLSFHVIEKWIKNGKIIIFFVMLFVSVQYLNSCYHESFLSENQFHPLYKIEYDEIDVLSYLTEQTKNSTRPYRVVSQIDVAKGYVNHIQMMYKIRGYDKYSLNNESSMLLRLFIKRDYPGQIIFENEPNFYCMCDTLINKRVDFVIVDKEQVFVDGDKVLPIEFLVRDCAEVIFENKRFTLYRFYWDE